MPKISKEAKAQRRRQIIEAAKTCFSQRGFEQTSIDDVCEYANLSKGAVYLYFKTKDELIWAIIDAQAERLRMFTADKTASELLRVLRDLIQSGLQDSDGMRLEFYTIVRAFSDPTTRSKYLGNINTIRGALLDVVEQMTSSGTVANRYGNEAAVDLLETMLLGLMMRCVFPELAPRADQLTLMLELLLQERA